MAEKGFWSGAVTILGDVGAALFGGILGAKWAGGEKPTEEIGRRAGEAIWKILHPDREDIMREILYLGDEVKALHDLLVEAERNKGFVVEDGKRYFENWMINMLLKIDPRHRVAVFRLLNEVLEVQGRKAFFTHLEILSDDGWFQYLKLVKFAIEDGMTKVKEKLPALKARIESRRKKLDHWAANTAAPAVDKLLRRLEKLDRKERRAEKKGVRR